MCDFQPVQLGPARASEDQQQQLGYTSQLRPKSRSKGTKTTRSQHQLVQGPQTELSCRELTRILFTGKDLVIRMLAEVFQVWRSPSGQLRWHQISSGLVPVSLYSRTTANWLNYLSNASSMDSTNSQSAMSPDSRQLILLLQQFHQQNRNPSRLGSTQDLLVFQVVAHDYIEGQFRTILNNKLTQPGTKLGLASEYFVYWKESPFSQQLSSSSSRSLQTQQQQYCYNQLQQQPFEPRTWGLNFASINDANLFYDICSLNLVDLDFNSDYLRQFTLADREQLSFLQASQQQFENNKQQAKMTNAQLQHHHLHSHNQHLNKLQAPDIPSFYNSGQDPSLSRASSRSRLASKQVTSLQHNQQQQDRVLEQTTKVRHHSDLEAGQFSAKRRAKSRSRSKPPKADELGPETRDTQQTCTKRVRSFSTPNSPKTRQAHELNQRDVNVDHHPRCLTMLNRAKQQTKSGQYLQSSEKRIKRPEKPPRGVLRIEPDSQQYPPLVPSSLPVPPKNLVLQQEQIENKLPSPLNQQEVNENARFVGNRATQRRSTGIETSNIEQLNEDLSHRTARLARAQYANSRNLKDFLSLDVGNASSQMTPPNGLQFTTSLEKANTKKCVSTTTEDLPLDEKTRIRMQRLNEIESQRRQSEDRGIHARSDAGRRRSLERSSRVEINESSLRPNHTHSQLNQQIPTLHSLSPLPAEQSEPRSSPSEFDGQQYIIGDQDSKKRSHTKSTGEYSQMTIRKRQQQQAPAREPIHSFKSEPNVLHECKLAESKCSQDRIIQGQIPAVLAYETCLNWDKPRTNYNYTRHSSYSCPNTLDRTVGRASHNIPTSQNSNCVGQANEDSFCPHSQPNEDDQKFLTATNSNSASASWKVSIDHNQRTHKSQPQPQPQYPWIVRSIHHQPLQSSSSCQTTSRCHNLDCNFRWPAKTSNEYEVSNALRLDECPIHCVSNVFRPESRLSSRSSVRYGLYDSSDSELELERAEMVDMPARLRPVLPILHLDEQAHSTSCCWLSAKTATSAATLVSPYPISRSTSGYLRPSASGSHPVDGYDQTLARQALRERPRAKSQPPRSTASDESALFLARSMENLRKLMKEVQFELSALKQRRPLLELHQRADHSVPSVFQNVLARPQIESVKAKLEVDEEMTGGASKISFAANKASKERDGQALHEATGTCDDDTLQAKHPRSATRRAGQFTCVGAIRKAGFLAVKKWLLSRRRSIELARKQGWKRYWVCLRGTSLLFHSIVDSQQALSDTSSKTTNLLAWVQNNCGPGNGQNVIIQSLITLESGGQANQDTLAKLAGCYIEREPRHLILLDGSLAQPIFEHPRRDHMFCLSTTFGDAYLFQASCQTDNDNWILAIHNACAASLARDQTRDEAKRLFEGRIRKLELEAEMKLFLKQRLESRLTSMCSMGYRATDDASESEPQVTYVNLADVARPLEEQYERDGRKQMRGLLLQLNHLLLALDAYLEQLHCEIYQLRCYLSSCESVGIFYHHSPTTTGQLPGNEQQQFVPLNLPHPRSLLMHVSKPSKLLLNRLGLFTVSSFHAYIYARQGSAESLIQVLDRAAFDESSAKKLLGESEGEIGNDSRPKVTTQLLAHSIAKSILHRSPNLDLESNAEQLIDLTDLSPCTIRLTRSLCEKIRIEAGILHPLALPDCFCMSADSETISIELEFNSKCNSMTITRRIMDMIVKDGQRSEDIKQETGQGEFRFLDFYLEVCTRSSTDTGNKKLDVERSVAKRDEKLSDWTDLEYLELKEKIVFSLDLRSTSLEDKNAAAPFGISIGAQLFVGKLDSLLSVFCSYIEWGSAADKADLRDEDELLAINGVPVAHLDLMYIECLLLDELHLRLVVQSSRVQHPAGSILLEHGSWRPLGEGDDPNINQRDPTRGQQGLIDPNSQYKLPSNGSSRLITDEYIDSLVCPPPPPSSQIHLCMKEPCQRTIAQDKSLDKDIESRSEVELIPRARSEQNFASGLTSNDQVELICHNFSRSTTQSSGARDVPPMDTSCIERLRKSIIELMETEYTYVHYLETINECYLCPLETRNFLDISELKSLARLINELIDFHRAFFTKLTSEMLASVSLDNHGGFHLDYEITTDEDVDKLNRIIELMQSSFLLEHFQGPLGSIVRVFECEADKFKRNAAYCDFYSRFQKILHPKMAQSYSRLQSSCIVLLPSQLDHFSLSGRPSEPSILPSSLQNHRDSLITLSSLIDGSKSFQDSYAKSKRFKEFLTQLDSRCSSSVSSTSLSTVDYNTRKGSEVEVNTISGSGPEPSKQINPKLVQKQQNFESYLIKPIQRIVRYPMLLGAIFSTVSTSIEPDLETRFKAIIKRMEAITSFVNDTQRINDEYGLVFECIQRQYLEQQATYTNPRSPPLYPTVGPASQASKAPHQPQIDLGSESLLFFSPVDWLNVRDFAPKLKSGSTLSQLVFVFKSCVIFICKETSALSQSTNSDRSKSKSKTKLRQSQPFPTTTTGTANSQVQERSSLFASLMSRTSAPSLGNGASDHTNSFDIIRYQTLIPVSEVQVRSVPVDTSSSGQPWRGQSLDGHYEHRWELFRCSSVNSNSDLLAATSTKVNSMRQQQEASSRVGAGGMIGGAGIAGSCNQGSNGKVYLLASETNEIRSAFLRNIRKTIRDSVRNMILPTTKPISSNFEVSRKLHVKPTSNHFVSSPSSGPRSQESRDSSCSQATNSFSPLCSAISENLNSNGNQDRIESDNQNGADTTTQSSHTLNFEENLHNFKNGIQVNN